MCDYVNGIMYFNKAGDLVKDNRTYLTLSTFHIDAKWQILEGDNE